MVTFECIQTTIKIIVIYEKHKINASYFLQKFTI